MPLLLDHNEGVCREQRRSDHDSPAAWNAPLQPRQINFVTGELEKVPAKALGLSISDNLLTLADEVIEWAGLLAACGLRLLLAWALVGWGHRPQPHSNLANNLFASSWDNRRPINSIAIEECWQKWCQPRMMVLLPDLALPRPLHDRGGLRRVTQLVNSIKV